MGINNLKSYHLSPQLKAELNHKRRSSTPFSTLSFRPLSGFQIKKLPIKGIGLFLGVFAFIVLSYVGVKSVYEYSSKKTQIAQEATRQSYEQRLAQMKSEVQAQASDAASFVELSQKYLKEKNLEKAEIAANMAVEKNPVWRDGFINQGHIFLVVSKFAEAKTAFEKALKIDPLSGQAHYLLSLTYQELKDNNSAKAEFAKAKQFGFETEIGG